MRGADYVEMTTTSIASSGAGAVTCIAITNRPTFTLTLGSAARFVRYVIEDTVNKKFEQGIGSVASNVLTRTRPQITWDGTSWLDAAPSALTFTGSPTSGDIRIRLAAVAEECGIVMPGFNATIAGDSNWRDYRWGAQRVPGSSGGGQTLTADRENYSYYRLDSSGLLLGMQFEVTAAVALSNLKVSLYDISHTGLPAAKIVDFNTTATTTTGIKTDTTTALWSTGAGVWLTPGWYAIGFISGHAIGIRCDGTSNGYQQTPAGREGSYGPGPGVYVAGSYSTGLPATPSLGGGSMYSGRQDNPGTAWIGLKVVA